MVKGPSATAPAKLTVSATGSPRRSGCSITALRTWAAVMPPNGPTMLAQAGCAVTPDGRLFISCSTLSFGSGAAEHLFCSVCGVKSFYRPRSNPDGWSVNARCLDETDDLVDDLAALEDHHGRDAAHHVLHGRLGVVVDVELAHRDLARVIGRQRLDRRREHAAGAAPLRPEVDDHRLRRLEHRAVPVTVREGLHVLRSHVCALRP